jgi:hypothetical protein
MSDHLLLVVALGSPLRFVPVLFPALAFGLAPVLFGFLPLL